MSEQEKVGQEFIESGVSVDRTKAFVAFPHSMYDVAQHPITEVNRHMLVMTLDEAETVHEFIGKQIGILRDIQVNRLKSENAELREKVEDLETELDLMPDPG